MIESDSRFQNGDSNLQPETAEKLDFYDDSDAPKRALLALEAGRIGSWVWDIPAGTVTGDPFFADLLNLNVNAQPWMLDSVFASMHPDNLPVVQAAVATALDGDDI